MAKQMRKTGRRATPTTPTTPEGLEAEAARLKSRRDGGASNEDFQRAGERIREAKRPLAPHVAGAAGRVTAWQARAEAALDACAAEVWVLGGNWSGKTRYLGYAGVKRAMRAGAGKLVYFCCQDHGVQRDTIQPEVVRYIAPYEYP